MGGADHPVRGILPLLDAVVLVLFTGLLHQIGLRQGGTGPYSRYLTTDGFQTSTVGLVTLPITLVGSVIQRALDQGMPWLDYLLGFPTAVWGVALAVISLRAGMRLSTRSAIVTILIAVTVGAVMVGLLTCVAVGFVIAG